MMKIGDMIFRCTNLPADEFIAGRNGDYIWRDLWTEASVCNRPVTGSHGFGSSHRLEQCCMACSAPFSSDGECGGSTDSSSSSGG